MFVVGPGSATDWSPRLTGLLEAAHAAGVRRAVLLSARGVQFLPDGAVARAEQALRKGPLPWTILRPSHFAQNFTEAMFAPRGGLISAPVGMGAEPFIDVADIADVAAAVLPGGFEGETLALSGPEAADFVQAAQILTEASGTPVGSQTSPTPTTWPSCARRAHPRATSSGAWPCSAVSAGARTPT